MLRRGSFNPSETWAVQDFRSKSIAPPSLKRVIVRSIAWTRPLGRVTWRSVERLSGEEATSLEAVLVRWLRPSNALTAGLCMKYTRNPSHTMRRMRRIAKSVGSKWN